MQVMAKYIKSLEKWTWDPDGTPLVLLDYDERMLAVVGLRSGTLQTHHFTGQSNGNLLERNMKTLLITSLLCWLHRDRG